MKRANTHTTFFSRQQNRLQSVRNGHTVIKKLAAGPPRLQEPVCGGNDMNHTGSVIARRIAFLEREVDRTGSAADHVGGPRRRCMRLFVQIEESLVLVQGKTIGHAGDVIGDQTGAR